MSRSNYAARRRTGKVSQDVDVCVRSVIPMGNVLMTIQPSLETSSYKCRLHRTATPSWSSFMKMYKRWLTLSVTAYIRCGFVWCPSILAEDNSNTLRPATLHKSGRQLKHSETDCTLSHSLRVFRWPQPQLTECHPVKKKFKGIPSEFLRSGTLWSTLRK